MTENAEKRADTKAVKEIKDWIITFLVAFACAFAINKLVFFIAIVPTGSMIPVINPEEKVLVTRVYNPNNLERGDIVVFDSDESGLTLLKRLIAKPGDRVQIVDGIVSVNGEALSESYVHNRDNVTAFDGKELTVPANGFLFLGDNRLMSMDARYWQQTFIEGDKITGKVQFRIYPISRIGLPR